MLILLMNENTDIFLLKSLKIKIKNIIPSINHLKLEPIISNPNFYHVLFDWEFLDTPIYTRIVYKDISHITSYSIENKITTQSKSFKDIKEKNYLCPFFISEQLQLKYYILCGEYHNASKHVFDDIILKSKEKFNSSYDDYALDSYTYIMKINIVDVYNKHPFNNLPNEY